MPVELTNIEKEATIYPTEPTSELLPVVSGRGVKVRGLPDGFLQRIHIVARRGQRRNRLTDRH